MDKYIITPSTQKAKHIASKHGLTMTDMVFMFTTIVFAVGFVFVWYSIFSLTAGFYIFTVLTILLFGGFLFYNLAGKSTNNLEVRNYQKNFIKIINKTKKKSVFVNELNSIFPKIRFQDNKTFISTKNQKEIEIEIYEINAESLKLYSDTEISKIIKEIYKNFKILENNIKFLILDNKVDLNKNIQYFQNLSNKEMNPEIQNFMNQYIDILNEQQTKDGSTFKKHFYMINQINEHNVEMNKSFFNNLKTILNTQQIFDKEQITNIFNNIYCASENESKIYNSNFKNNFNFDEKHTTGVEFNNKYYESNNEFHSILNVYTYPLSNSHSWMSVFNKLKNTSIIQDICPIPKTQRNDMLHKFQLTLKANRQFISTQMEQLDQSMNLNKIHDTMEELINNNDLELLKMTTTLIVHGRTLEQLNQNIIKTINDLKQHGYEINTLEFQQSNILPKIMNFNNVNNKSFLWNEVTNKSYAAGYPYNSTLLNDQEGIFLGTNKENNNPIILDVTKQDALTKRTSGSGSICGSTGNGKTFMLSYMIALWYFKNSKIIIFDPLKDYYGFTKYFNAVILNIGQGGQEGTINIFECFDQNIINIENKTLELEAHIDFIIQLILKLKTNIKDSLLTGLNKSLYLFFKHYEQQIITKKLWPTTTDFRNFIYNIITKDGNKDYKYGDEIIYKEIFNDLKDLSFNLCNGIAGKLWNGQTSFNVNKAKMIIFDTSTLEQLDKRIQDVQISLIFNFMNKILWQNTIDNKAQNKKDWIYLIFDEAHRFINKNQKLTSDMIERFAREIRHFDGSMFLSTQNFADFKSEQAKKILALGMYQFSKGISSVDINDYKALFSGNREITTEEMKQIENLTKFETVLNIRDMKNKIQMPDLSVFKEVWDNEKKPTK